MNFDLRTCIEDVVDLVSAQAHLKELELNILINPNIPNKLVGDLVKLNQVLSILLTSAIKRTNTGEITIQVGLKQETDSAVTILFEVIDTSSGLSSEEQYILSSFLSQADSSVSKDINLQSVDIDLVVCHRLIRMMAGEINLEIGEERGLTFWFSLTFHQQSGTIAPAIDLSGLRLLIVSENPNTRAAIQQQVRLWNISTVDEAINATTAMNALRNAVAEDKPYQIALIDMQMSVLSGEVLGKAIGSDPTIGPTKLIIMTFIQQQEMSERLINLGFSAILVKPIKQLPLLHVLLDVSAELQLHTLETDDEDGDREAQITALPMLDLHHLIRICEGDRQAMLNMIDQFLEDGPKRAAMMSDAIAGNDFFSLGQHAHFLKGSSVTLGSAFAANIADRLKQQASNHNTSGCLSMVLELQKAIEQLQENRKQVIADLNQILVDEPKSPPVTFSATDTPVRILLVDDDLMTLTWLSDRLQQLPNYKVTTASSGEMAWNCVCTDTFNIIVSDWSMPDMSGIVLCQRLKFCPQLPSALAPFILLTAFKDVDYQRIARDAGVDDFIVKPVNPDDLRTKIAFWTSSDSLNI